MAIFIYEDQNGNQVYPKGSNHNEEYIKKKFFNNITLDLNRKGDTLTVTCFVIARGVSRDERYYIKYIDKCSGKIFENFKNQADIALSELNYKPRLDDRNTIFNNIAKFDEYQFDSKFQADIKYYSENENDILKYLGGNISNLSNFCSNILRQLKNVNVVISFNKCKYGNFNIFIENNKYEGIIQQTIETKQKLLNYKIISNKLEKEKNKKDSIYQIKNGIYELTYNCGLNKNEVKDILINILRDYRLEINLHKEEKPRLEEKSINKSTVSGLDPTISRISGNTKNNNNDENFANVATKKKWRLPIKIIPIILLFIIAIYLFINPSIILPFIKYDIFNTTNNTSNSNSDYKIIKVENNKIYPNTTEINIGQKVKWQNNDNISYKIIGRNNFSVTLNIGGYVEKEFNEIGEFNFSIFNKSDGFSISQIIVR